MESVDKMQDMDSDDKESSSSDKNSSDSGINISTNKESIELQVYTAIRAGNTDIAREIIKSNLEYITKISAFDPSTGETPLHQVQSDLSYVNLVYINTSLQ